VNEFQARPYRKAKWSLTDVLFAAALGVALGVGIAEYLAK